MTKFLLEPKCSPGQVILVDGAKIENGTNIHLWGLGQGIQQYFKFINSGDDYIFIEASYSEGKVIDISFSEVKNGTNIYL